MNTPFVVVVSSYQTLQYAQQCIDSVAWQQAGEYAIDFASFDDASTYTPKEDAHLQTIVERAGGRFLYTATRRARRGGPRRRAAVAASPPTARTPPPQR
jgi:hypothetical protein